MFTKDTLIKTSEGNAYPIGDLLGIGVDQGELMGATKPAGEVSAMEVPRQTSTETFLELVSASGRRVKCSLKAKLCLSSGGFAYAEESVGTLAGAMIVDTEAGPERITEVIGTDASIEELVAIRLSRFHLVNANGFWFLTE